jgi:hypothetical protein
VTTATPLLEGAGLLHDAEKKGKVKKKHLDDVGLTQLRPQGERGSGLRGWRKLLVALVEGGESSRADPGLCDIR